VKLFVVAVLGIAPPVLVGLWAGRRVEHRPSLDHGVEANARLIGCFRRDEMSPGIPTGL
jgi:hypothetical protein